MIRVPSTVRLLQLHVCRSKSLVNDSRLVLCSAVKSKHRQPKQGKGFATDTRSRAPKKKPKRSHNKRKDTATATLDTIPDAAAAKTVLPPSGNTALVAPSSSAIVPSAATPGPREPSKPDHFTVEAAYRARSLLIALDATASQGRPPEATLLTTAVSWALGHVMDSSEEYEGLPDAQLESLGLSMATHISILDAAVALEAEPVARWAINQVPIEHLPDDLREVQMDAAGGIYVETYDGFAKLVLHTAAEVSHHCSLTHDVFNWEDLDALAGEDATTHDVCAMANSVLAAIAPLLCEAAAVEYERMNYSQAVVAGCGAYYCNGSCVEGLLWAARAGEQLGWPEALQCCSAALARSPGLAARTELLALEKRLKARAARFNKKVKQGRHSFMGGPGADWSQAEEEAVLAVRPSAVRMLDEMKDEEKRAAFAAKSGRAVPAETWQLVLTNETLTQGCEGELCAKRLMHGTMKALEIVMDDAARRAGAGNHVGGVDNESLSTAALTWRLQKCSEEWWRAAEVGDVAIPDAVPQYHDVVERISSFTNEAQLALPIQPGGTHVAVGFVDLGELAETLVAWEGAQKGVGMRSRWVGYEASSFNCAKAAVILKMLQRSAEVDSIVQVWYSAAWSSAALRDFRSAVAALLADGPSDPELRRWLSHWRTATVPLEQARRTWLFRHFNDMARICDMKTDADLAACGTYAITGQLLHATTGSVLMFAEPPAGKAKQVYLPNESFLQTISDTTLLQQRRKEDSFVDAGVAVVRRRVEALGRAVQSGDLSIEMHNHRIASGSAEAGHIRSLQPSSVSWSNVPDYMLPEDFHQLAQEVAPSAPHFLHVMNWLPQVKGAYLIDYMSMPKSSPEQVQQRNDIEQRADALGRRVFEETGCGEYLHWPPHTFHPNVSCTLLSTELFEKWLEAFKARGRGQLRLRCSTTRCSGRLSGALAAWCT